MTNLMFLTNRQQWIKGAVTFVVVFALMTCLKDEVALVHSTTDSLPHRTFLNLKHMSPKKGSYTIFNSPWYGSPVIKKIIGTAGDTLVYDQQGHLWVGRQLRIEKPKKKSKDGRVLTPVKPGIIPKGMVFVAGEHERSFDSRYAELGLIPEHALQGRLIGLL